MKIERLFWAAVSPERPFHLEKKHVRQKDIGDHS